MKSFKKFLSENRFQYSGGGSADAKLLRIIFKDPKEIKNIENPSDQLIMTALFKDVNVLKYIKNPSQKVKDIANILKKQNPTNDMYIQLLNLADTFAYNHIMEKTKASERSDKLNNALADYLIKLGMSKEQAQRVSTL